MAQRHDPPAQGFGRDRFVRWQMRQGEKAVIARRIIKRGDFRLGQPRVAELFEWIEEREGGKLGGDAFFLLPSWEKVDAGVP
jgi:hypothetical protein